MSLKTNKRKKGVPISPVSKFHGTYIRGAFTTATFGKVSAVTTAHLTTPRAHESTRVESRQSRTTPKLKDGRSGTRTPREDPERHEECVSRDKFRFIFCFVVFLEVVVENKLTIILRGRIHASGTPTYVGKDSCLPSTNTSVSLRRTQTRNVPMSPS